MSEPEYEHRSFRTISKSFGFSGKAAIKRVLLAVAQSRSLHVVHEAYFCESCFRDAIYQF